MENETTKVDTSGPIPKDMSKEREERCVPIAREILSIMASGGFMMGDVKDKEAFEKSYAQGAADVYAKLEEKDILIAERMYIFQLIKQVVENLEALIMTAIDERYRAAAEQKFGKPGIELRMSDIKTDAPKSV